MKNETKESLYSMLDERLIYMKEWNGKRYHSLNYFLRNKYGEKIYKIPLDGGFANIAVGESHNLQWGYEYEEYAINGSLNHIICFWHSVRQSLVGKYA